MQNAAEDLAVTTVDLPKPAAAERQPHTGSFQRMFRVQISPAKNFRKIRIRTGPTAVNRFYVSLIRVERPGAVFRDLRDPAEVFLRSLA